MNTGVSKLRASDPESRRADLMVDKDTRCEIHRTCDDGTARAGLWSSRAEAYETPVSCRSGTYARSRP